MLAINKLLPNFNHVWNSEERHLRRTNIEENRHILKEILRKEKELKQSK